MGALERPGRGDKTGRRIFAKVFADVVGTLVVAEEPRT